MAKSVKVGDKVKTTAVKDWNGTHLASFVRKNTYDVIQVGGKNLSANRIVIGKGKAVTAAVHLNTLTVVSSKSKKTTTLKKTSTEVADYIDNYTAEHRKMFEHTNKYSIESTLNENNRLFDNNTGIKKALNNCRTL